MPNYNQLILTAADYKFFLSLPGGPTLQLKTIESVNLDITTEEELIYMVGEEDPGGNKSNANAYKGKVTLQAGEVNAIKAIAAVRKMIDIKGAILACAAIQGAIDYTFTGLNFNSEKLSVKRKEKETLIDSDFTSLGII